MMFRLATLIAAAAVPVAMALEAKGPADMCHEQAGCIEFDIIEEAEPGCSGDCYFKVCMTIKLGSETCIKTGSFSHTCVKDPTQCEDPDLNFSKATNVTEVTSGVGTGYTQCQLVPAGSAAEFLLKDGGKSTCVLSGDYETYTVGEYTATCEAFDENTGISCTGGGSGSGGECIWRIPVPECSSTTAPIVTSKPPEDITTTPATGETTTAVTTTKPYNSGGGGDPHFQRWEQEHSTFHGECDLVLIHSKDFHNGAGLDMHARTTIHSYYSFIESIALRVAGNTVELENEAVTVNGQKLAYETDLPYTFGDEFHYTVSLLQSDKFVKLIQLDLGDDSIMTFKFYKHYLTFKIAGHANDFADTVGLLGEYGTGNMYSREGVEMDDFVQYGFEWQVSPEDAQIFSVARSPQLPFESCRMPTKARPSRRHLRADRILFESAKTACASKLPTGGNDFDLCVDDVMMTGDVELAYQAW